MLINAVRHDAGVIIIIGHIYTWLKHFYGIAGEIPDQGNYLYDLNVKKNF